MSKHLTKAGCGLLVSFAGIMILGALFISGNIPDYIQVFGVLIGFLLVVGGVAFYANYHANTCSLCQKDLGKGPRKTVEFLTTGRKDIFCIECAEVKLGLKDKETLYLKIQTIN